VTDGMVLLVRGVLSLRGLVMAALLLLLFLGVAPLEASTGRRASALEPYVKLTATPGPMSGSASATFAAPITIGTTAPSPAEGGMSVQPDPGQGGWVQVDAPTGEELTRIDEDGRAMPVSLPSELRGEGLDFTPLSDGWAVASDRYWPGGRSEEQSCSGLGSSERCGVLVVAQLSPKGRWTNVRRLPHSFGKEAYASEPIESSGRIELAWSEEGEGGESRPIRVALALPGHPFGPAHIARRVLHTDSEHVSVAAVRGALYLRAEFGPHGSGGAGDHVVERRLYDDGRLGAPHFLRSPLVRDQGQSLPGRNDSEIYVFQSGEEIGVARRAGWASTYESPHFMTSSAEYGFQVAEAPNHRILLSVRSSKDERSRVIAAEVSRAGRLGATQTVEYDPRNHEGEYDWTSAINDAGQALVATVDEVAGDAIWLHPSTQRCRAFSRVLLTPDGSRALSVFAGRDNVFHLAWIDAENHVQSTSVRVGCGAR
jgi:hypothetical protein